MPGKLSRRDFLKAGVGASGAALLAAKTPLLASPIPSPARQSGTKKLIFSSYSWSGYEEALNQVIDTWIQTQTDGNVEVERQYAPWDDYWGKLQTQVAAGTPPDLGIADYSRIVSYAKSGIIRNITDFVQSSDIQLDRMIPASLEQYRWAEGDFDTGNPDGDFYGLPTDGQSMVMFYNKRMFDEAGIGYPTDDWTWDDLLEAAKATTKPDQTQFGFNLPVSYTWRGIWVKAAGGSFHTPDYRKSMLNSPETREAMTWLWDTYYTHKVAPPPSAGGTGTHPFIGRQVAMAVDGVWWISDVANGLEEGEWDICMFPKHPRTGLRTTTVEADGWWIFKDAKEPELAWSLMQYMVSEAGQRQFDQFGYLVPGVLSDVSEEWYGRTPPENRHKVLDNILQDSVKVDITHYEVSAIQAVVDPIIQAAFADGTDIGQALEQAELVMNSELDRAWESFNR